MNRNKYFSALLILLSSFTVNIYAQFTVGYIYDNKTKEPIPYANVFGEGTLIGTSSDSAGFFKITSSIPSDIPLAINAIGYLPATITDHSPDKELNIFLNPRVYNIKEITVTHTGKRGFLKRKPWSRERMLRVFRNEFLGVTPNGIRCRIINPGAITLIHDYADNSLTAYCEEPIIIINEALGYEVHYFLEHFRHTPFETSYSGRHYFNAVDIPESELEKVERNRGMTYRGSAMHFIRALSKGDLESSDYKLYVKSENKIIDPAAFLGWNEGDFYLRLDSRSFMNDLQLIYEPNRSASGMKIVKDSVLISNTGYFDPLGIIWSGDIAQKRVGDLLPYDYNASE